MPTKPRPPFAALCATLVLLLAAGPAPAQDGEVDGKIDVPLPRERPEAAPGEDAGGPVETDEDDATHDADDDTVADDTPPAPPRVYQAACPAVLRNLVEAETLPPIEMAGCGERDPLAVTALTPPGARIAFSETVTTNCRMATEMAAWAEAVDAYARAVLDTSLDTLVIAPGYVCRDVAGGEDAPRLSEHGFANAVDISALVFADGTRISVLDDWDDADAPAGRLLRHAHAAACARFTTVLGPDADPTHEDHFHFDLGCHGQSCTARICE